MVLEDDEREAGEKIMGRIYKFWVVLIGIIGSISLIYYIALMIMMGGSNAFYHVWLAIAVLCALLIVGITVTTQKGKLPPKWITIPVEILVGIGFLFFVIMEAIIVCHSKQTPPAQADYLIVLGAKVNGTHPSLLLEYRIQAAAKYLRENPGTIAIASGGQGSDEGISEAECIYHGLVAAGIAPERILLEDKSTSTRENLTYSGRIIQEHRIEDWEKRQEAYTEPQQKEDIVETVVVTTTDFHIFRSIRLAKKIGYVNVYGNAASSVWWLIPTNYVREFLAVVKDVIIFSYYQA